MMTDSELAALERVIANARINPIVLLRFTPQQIEEAIDDVRQIAVDGLTYRQAMRVAASVDTKEEEDRVRAALRSVANAEDAKLLTAWLLRAAKAALQAGAPTESPSQTVTPPGVGDPVVYLPLTCGWYNDYDKAVSAVRWIANEAAARSILGRVGVCLETSGSTGNLGVATADWSKAYADHASKAAGLVALCARLGVPVKIDAHNSNDPGKGWSKSWRKPHGADTLLRLVGQSAGLLQPYSAWLLVQGCSEDDSATPNRKDIRKAVAAKIKAERRAEPNRSEGARWNEVHISAPFSGAVARNTIYTTDNGRGITAHFKGGVWDAHEPKVDACVKTVSSVLRGSGRVALYHRAAIVRIEDHAGSYRKIMDAAAQILAGSAPQPQPGAGIAFKMHSPRNNYVSWSGVSRSGWPEKTVKAKRCNGLLYVNGKKCDWIPVGRENTGLKNSLPGGDFAQNIRKGDTIALSIRDIDGKLRNEAYIGTSVYA